ncbi:pur operon repressor [Fodinisporobacter ferrooxydans]|uniref:Pur operon repressor n=1 Tax=Fodinisporobacter ferrooxydans TaxID=2901836 RepID=A0ABY4CNA2_9BACL|nr:pur operon repressor [Alicyclobacillaceae bacterium MYW30-H2]
MRRSERIVRITEELLTHPYQIISLTDLAKRFEAAKSSLSEDLGIIREVLEMEGKGTLETQAGAFGGVRFIPGISNEEAVSFVKGLGRELATGDRVLPGGYLYMTDVLGRPDILDRAGRMFAERFGKHQVDVVMTVETKGIPLAIATSRYLHVSTVVVRRDQRVTEGSAVSINYVSGSGRRIQTMSLSRRSMPEHSRVLIVDDFMKAGGTAKGMIELLQEFRSEVVGVGVFMETAEPETKLVSNYVSVARLSKVDEFARNVEIELGNYFSKNYENNVLGNIQQ